MSAQSCSGDDKFCTEVKAEYAESPLSTQISKYDTNRKGTGKMDTLVSSSHTTQGKYPVLWDGNKISKIGPTYNYLF